MLAVLRLAGETASSYFHHFHFHFHGHFRQVVGLTLAGQVANCDRHS